ncbi:MAG: radical SAM family heme chaperone HemW [Clostridiales bacterium]|nr:radical SAM family heme chaperone HemW [Clostridiales bacterium]
MKKDLGIYVHIPYCAKKCEYCDFVSGVANREEIAYYIRVLMKEIRGYEALGNLYQVRTIFFGGGTPSLLDPMNLKRIMHQLRDQFVVLEDAEITVECNPGTLTEEKLAAYKEIGVNRLSIGLQSAQDEELKLLGRIHSWQDFVDNYKLARKMGFDNINVDLMSALPRQTLDTWKDTLEKVTELEPDHISAYSLIIEEGTPFYEKYNTQAGRAMLPGENEEREIYHYTGEFLAEKGYERYEISNYAKKGKECRHNITYWTGGDYVGVGLNASSYLEGRRFTNPRKHSDYWDHARQAYTKFRTMAPQSRKETMEEFVFLGLRMMKGISKREFEKRFALSFDEVYGEVAQKQVQQGFLVEDGEWLRFSEKGIDVSNRLLVDYLLDDGKYDGR